MDEEWLYKAFLRVRMKGFRTPELGRNLQFRINFNDQVHNRL